VDIIKEIEKVVSIKKMMFQKIGEMKLVSATVSYLMKISRQPIPILKNAAMDLMRSIASQGQGTQGNRCWGIPALFGNITTVNNNNDFWNFLKDRTTEFSKEGKDFKFALLQIIYRSPAMSLLGEDIQKHLKVMIDQGPYYMPPRMEEMETI
jgi:hypothetical protein